MQAFDKLNRFAGPMCLVLFLLAALNTYNDDRRRDDKVAYIHGIQDCAVDYGQTNGTNIKRRSDANDAKVRAEDLLLSGIVDILAETDPNKRTAMIPSVAELGLEYERLNTIAEQIKKDNPILTPPDCKRNQNDKE